MDLEALRASPVGQLVPISGQDERLQEYDYFAFVPDPLPDTVQLDGPTWNKVAEASEALGRLHQACATLPNPRLLIAPALAREAVDTSALEGTYGAVADVLEARLADAAPKSPEVAEIRAYERIAHKAFDWVRERPVTLGMLSDLQGELAADSTNSSLDPGRVRRHQVVIGPKGGSIYDARYIPPPPDDRLQSGLEHWQEWLERDLQLPPAVRAAMAHYQFESLHPFGDGNGRLGRLVIALQFMRAGILPEPALTISPWLRARREEYQGHLLAVSKSGDWSPWVAFFCSAIVEQARKSVEVVNELNSWLSGARQQLIERHWTGVIASVLEELIDWPVVKASWIQERHSVSAPTANGAIQRLVEIEVLNELTGRSYGRVYGATHVIRAVDAL